MVGFPQLLETNFFIYGARDLLDGEYRYIGLTSTGIQRLKTHVYIMRSKTHPEHNHYKYNWMRSCDNLVFDVLEYADDRKLLNSMERQWIAAYKEGGHRLTNLTDGGEGLFGYKFSTETRMKMSRSSMGRIVSEETRQRLSEARAGRPLTVETKQKLSERFMGESGYWYGKTGSDHPRFNVKASEETRKLQSEAKLGENHWAYGLKGEKHPNFGKTHSKETKKKISDAGKGRIVSDETRRKLSEAKFGVPNGRDAWNKGIPPSSETRDKISKALTGKPPKGQHTRWHTNRSIINPDCIFCIA